MQGWTLPSLSRASMGVAQVRRLDWIWDKRYDVLIDKAGIRFAQSLRSVAGVGIGQRERARPCAADPNSFIVYNDRDKEGLGGGRWLGVVHCYCV